MKLIVENMKKLSQRNKDRNVKRGIRTIRKEIKMEAKKGRDRCFVSFYENFSDTQQEVIGKYFIDRGFEVEWRYSDEIVIRWV